MKPKRFASRSSVFTSFVLAFSMVSLTHAASDSWDGSTDATWATGNNWLNNGTAPGAGETATFNGAGNGYTTIDLGAGVTIGSILFDTSSAAAYTIGSGAVGSQALTLGNVGALTINSGVTTNQLFNANIQLSNAANAATTITNNGSGLLTLAGTVNANVASGNGLLTVAGSGNTTVSGAVTKTGAGSNALKKIGSGTLTLSNGSVWSGTGASQPRGAGSGGNSAFTGPFFVQEGTLLLNGGTHTVTGEAVIGGISSTHGGAGQNAKLQVDSGSLTVSGYLSVGRGNGVGVATSDLVLNNAATVTAANFSAGFNGGSTLNTPKGTITLNGTSILSVTNIVNLAESAGSNFTLNINDTATFRQTTGNQTKVGLADGAVGIINVNGGTATFGFDLILGAGGTGSGKVVLDSGTVNVATTSERWVKLNDSASASTGQIDVNGGNLNLNTNSDIRFSTNGSSSGSNVVNLNTGAITGYTGNNNGVFSGGSVVDLNNASTQSGVSNTFNLNGGTLTIGQVITTKDNGTAAFNFNGGTLRAAAANTSFFVLGGASQRANVRNGGAIIDTNGVNVTIAEALQHSNIGSDNATDGGLTKNSLGTLTLSGANTYTGATAVSAGTLQFAKTNSMSASSAVSVASGATLAVNAGGTGEFAAGSGNGTIGGLFAGLGGQSGSTVSYASGATIGVDTTNATGSITESTALTGTGIGLTKLGTGTLILSGTNNYTGTTTVSAGTLALSGSGSLASTGAVNLSASGAAFDISAISGSSTTIGSLTGVTGSSVALGAKNLTVGDATTTTHTGTLTGAGGSLTKQGSGSLTLANAGSNFTGNITVNNGTLAANAGIANPGANAIAASAFGDIGTAAGARSINVNNGGTLSMTGGNLLGTGGSTNTLANITINVNQGGALQTGSSVTGSGWWNKIAAVNLDGGAIHVGSGANNAGFQGLALIGTVTVGGSSTTASTIDNISGSDATMNAVHLGQNGGANQVITFNVADVTGSTASDLNVSTKLMNTSNTQTASGLAKSGAGTMTLSGANTYSGGTTINGGTLALANNSAAGTSGVSLSGASAASLKINSGVTVANAITFSNTNASSSVIREVAALGTYDVGTSGALKSSFAGGKPDTTASILAGTNTGSTSTLTMSFSDSSAASNDVVRLSDVFSLSGTTVVSGSQTDTFVIQLSATGLATDSVLGWNQSGTWVNAVTGNTGAGGLAGSYAQSFADFLTANGGFNSSTMLGAYGFDSGSSSVWAVVNHNSEFAAIPELSNTLAGLLIGAGLLRRRRI
jgi:fibronectin-binding autotransporter adhesin